MPNDNVKRGANANASSPAPDTPEGSLALCMSAQEKEKARIGYELHDNISQIVTTAKLVFEMLQPENEGQRVLRCRGVSLLQKALNEINLLSRSLAIPLLKTDGISTALNSIIDDLRLTSSFEVIFQNTCDHLEELPPLQQTTLLRIIQEQSRNIVKHAHASYVHISLAFQGNTVLLEIKDDGIGFNQDDVPLGMGLVSIADRVKLCKGKFDIKSAPYQGTRLSVLLPRSI